MTTFSTILDLIFPSYCISCNKRGTYLCTACLSGVQEAERESESWIHPMFDYRNPVIKKSLHVLKYKNKKNLSLVFANILYPRILEELSELVLLENFKNPLLIPIPLSNTRKRERGFNQSELICKELQKLDQDKNFCFKNDILIKHKETPHQAHIKNRNERLKNLTNSFSIKNSSDVKSRNIILIDDITTTGATLNEAKKVLKHAGARKIIAFTVAH